MNEKAVASSKFIFGYQRQLLRSLSIRRMSFSDHSIKSHYVYAKYMFVESSDIVYGGLVDKCRMCVKGRVISGEMYHTAPDQTVVFVKKDNKRLGCCVQVANETLYI